MGVGKKTALPGNRIFYSIYAVRKYWCEYKLFIYLHIYFSVLLLTQNLWRRMMELLIEN